MLHTSHFLVIIFIFTGRFFNIATPELYELSNTLFLCLMDQFPRFTWMEFLHPEKGEAL